MNTKYKKSKYNYIIPYNKQKLKEKIKYKNNLTNIIFVLISKIVE